MADKYIISSPGKIILHGEHSVVYGKKALACSLNLRSFCKVAKNGTEHISVDLPDISLKSKWPVKDIQSIVTIPFCKIDTPVEASSDILTKIKAFLGIPNDTTDTKCLASVAFLYLSLAILPSTGELCGIDFHISSSLPTSAGLGSSAAYSTCLSAALLLVNNIINVTSSSNGSKTSPSLTKAQLDLINGWAFQSEKIIHGTPSGIDNAVSTYGGALVFQKGKITPIEKVPNIRILLVNTKIPRSTKTLVSGVRKKHAEYPSIIDPLFDSIEAITVQCTELLKEMEGDISSANLTKLNDLITMNQKILDILGVSHKSLDRVCEIAGEFDLAAKLTGAGGGGCAFILIPPTTTEDAIETIQCRISQIGYDVWETSVGGEGVVLHSEVDRPKYILPKFF